MATWLTIARAQLKITSGCCPVGGVSPGVGQAWHVRGSDAGSGCVLGVESGVGGAAVADVHLFLHLVALFGQPLFTLGEPAVLAVNQQGLVGERTLQEQHAHTGGALSVREQHAHTVGALSVQEQHAHTVGALSVQDIIWHLL